MEKSKKHIEFHVDIDESAGHLNVQIVAEQPTIANANNEDKQKVLRDIAAMVSAMADKVLDKEDT